MVFADFRFVDFSGWNFPPDYQHGYAFLAKQKYDRGFEHFDYVNPEAPKGNP